MATLVLLFPMMDLRVPVGRLVQSPATGPTLRLLTFNTHEHVLDAQGLREFIAAHDPQVVALQETIPWLIPTVFADGQWYTLTDDRFCLGCRYPIRKVGVVTRQPGSGPDSHSMPAVQYEIDSPFGVIPLLSVHLLSPHTAFRNTLHQDPTGPQQIQQNSADRLEEALRVRRAAVSAGRGVLLAGDFNMPTDTQSYRRAFSSFTNAFDESGVGLAGPTMCG